MGKGKSGKKPNMAAKRKRATYQAEMRYEKNKRRKAAKEERKYQKLLKEGKGPYAKVTEGGTNSGSKPSTTE